LVAALAIGAAPARQSAVQPTRPPRAQKAEASRHIISTGRVTEIHGRRLFSMREAEGAEREVLVLAPRPLSMVIVGSTVRVEGRFRRFAPAELRDVVNWSDIDAHSRARFSGRPVLVAASLVASLQSEVPPPVSPDETEPAEARAPERPRSSVEAATSPPLTISASMLGANFDQLAGQDVRILKARVVGLLEPGALLVEPATRYLKPMGARDRIAVLIPHGTLRVPAELLVGSTVVVEGTARTVLGLQVSAEVPWPAQLGPKDVKRLEVRGAVLATSVRTAEGTELTVH
jgi:hypothetical protein